MRWIWTAAWAIVIALAMTAAVNADTFGAAPFWPNDGVWVYYDTEGDSWEVGIWVYCGPNCGEWANIYEVPPSPTSQWVHDPVNHSAWWDYPGLYAQFEHGYGDGWTETYFTGYTRAGWNCDDGNRAMLNQEYIDYGLYWGIGGYPGYIPACDSWGGGLQYGFPIWNWGEWDWYVNRNNWNQLFFDSIQSNYGASIHVESAYRNPHKQSITPGGAANSRHQWGDALDVKPDGFGTGCTLGGDLGTGSVWERLYYAAYAAGATFVEPWSASCSHVHGDYRSW